MNNMNIMNVNASVYASSTVVQQNTTTVKEAGKETTTSSTQIKQDTFVASASVSTAQTGSTDSTQNITYEKPKKLTAEQLQTISDQRLASFKNMLSNMLGKQVTTLNKALFDGITISEEDKKAAQAAIAPGGEWSPEVVAGNILDMAKALSGGDVSKLELLKDAVNKGFQSAASTWGGKMPSITDETYDLVMKGFDDWANEGKEVEETDEAASDDQKTEKTED